MPAESAEFERAADELYALAPQDFVAARDERAASVRQSGELDLARQLRALRRPTQGAWLVNLLWRNERDSMESLLDLGVELREAQQRPSGERLSGERLRELSAQRHRVVGALVTRARRLASASGVKVTAETALEVEETLNAALASHEVAEQVRSGRLVRPVSYAGFGPDVSMAGRAARQERAPSPGAPGGGAQPATGTPAAPGQPGQGVQRAADRAANRAANRAREAASEAVDAARAALTEAQRERESRGKALEAAVRRRDEMRTRLAELREQVRDLERRSAASELDVRSETRRHQQAEAAEEAARRRLDRAEQRLDRLQR